MAEGGGAPGGAAVGRFVTVHFKAAPSGLGFEVVEQAGPSLRLKPLLSRGALPFAGERVECRSSAGQWTTTVRSTGDGLLEVAPPRWLSRPAQRRWRRVPVGHAVAVHRGERTWAARLQDVSMKGAAVLLERSAGVRPGDALTIDVPGGSIQATVRSVRHHAQRLLVVAGVAYDRLEPAALRFVAAAVAGRAPASGAPSEPG